MTRIAVITDTHANLPALDAALTAIRGLGCEAVYHTGDAVGAGPYPRETLDRLLHTPRMHLVMGNHDELCGFGIPEPVPDWMDDLLVANAEWTRAQVEPAVVDAVAAWPYAIIETIAGQPVAFLHYPRDHEGNRFATILEEPDAEDLDVLFTAVPAGVIFYGHHHPAADLSGRSRYINPGSLGCGPDTLARFAVVESRLNEALTIHHYAVPYDRTPLHAALIRRDVPGHEFLRQAFFP